MRLSNLTRIAGLLICCLVFAAVPASAETYHEIYDDQNFVISHTEGSPGAGTTQAMSTISFPDYASNWKYQGLSFIGYSTYTGSLLIENVPENYNYDIIIYSSTGNIIATGTITWDKTYNALGTYTQGDFWIVIDDFYYNNITLDSSFAIYYPDGTIATQSIRMGGYGSYSPTFDNDNELWWKGSSATSSGKINLVYNQEWQTEISGSYGSVPSTILVDRYGYGSNFSLWNDLGTLLYNDYSASNIDYSFAVANYTYQIVNPYGKIYTKILATEVEPVETISVLASVKNIQDYSVIGDSTISFVSDTENITRTMPNGYDLFTLAKDTWYNVSASAEGFTPQLEYEPNLWTGSSAIDVWMIPTSEESNETVQMNWYVSESNSAGPGTLRLSNAVISINSKTLITDASGYASTILNRSGSISYTVKKDGYNTYSRAFTPNWDTYTFPTIDEHITLLKMGEPIGDVTPVPTPDPRSSNQKAESAMNILFDNIEGIVQLAVLVLIISLISMIAGGGKKR